MRQWILEKSTQGNEQARQQVPQSAHGQRGVIHFDSSSFGVPYIGKFPTGVWTSPGLGCVATGLSGAVSEAIINLLLDIRRLHKVLQSGSKQLVTDWKQVWSRQSII